MFAILGCHDLNLLYFLVMMCISFLAVWTNDCYSDMFMFCALIIVNI